MVIIIIKRHVKRQGMTYFPTPILSILTDIFKIFNSVKGMRNLRARGIEYGRIINEDLN